MTNREIALEQALVAVMAEAKKLGVDLDDLISEVKGGLMGHDPYRHVDHPHNTNAIQEVLDAKDAVDKL